MSGSTSEDPESEIINDSLDYLQTSLFASVLEDTITELRILAETSNELRVMKAFSDMEYLRRIKYSVNLPPVTDELAAIDPRNLGRNEYTLNKLDADRKLALRTAIETYKDLAVSRSYDALTNHVNKAIGLDEYRFKLEEDEARNRVIRRELAKQVRQQRNHITTVLYDTNATIEDLKNKVEDGTLYSECRSRYVDNWQRARTEQHLQTINNQEKGPSESIEQHKMKTDHEQRVHSEVEILMNIAINETLQKVDEWMNKYDRDMEDIDLKIQIKKNEYQDMLDKRIGLEKKLEKHDQLMKDWIDFKEERRKAREYHEKMTNAAIVVQAWWRGLLVRRQLGPYKVAKKKGAGKKK